MAYLCTLHSIHCTAYLLGDSIPAWGQHTCLGTAYLLGDSSLDMPGQMQTALQGVVTSLSTHAYNSQKTWIKLAVRECIRLSDGFAHAQSHSQLHVQPSLGIGTHRATKQSLQSTHTDGEVLVCRQCRGAHDAVVAPHQWAAGEAPRVAQPQACSSCPHHCPRLLPGTNCCLPVLMTSFP